MCLLICLTEMGLCCTRGRNKDNDKEVKDEKKNDFLFFTF